MKPYILRDPKAVEPQNRQCPPLPPPPPPDRGGAGREAALIAHLRQRGRSWRTEQTYRGWRWRFVTWLESHGQGKAKAEWRNPTAPRRSSVRPWAGGGGTLAEVGAAEIREFPSMLAVVEQLSVATNQPYTHVTQKSVGW